MSQQLDPKVRAAVLGAILKHVDPDQCTVFLFGSYATGEAIDSSDIDVGLCCNAPCPAKDFLAIQEEIQNTSPSLCKIDLVDFNDIDQVVKQEALKAVQLWHVGKNCSALLASLRPPRQDSKRP